MAEYRAPRDVAEAIAIQNMMRGDLKIYDDFTAIKTLAGMDVGYDPVRDLSRAAVVLIDAKTLDILCSVIAYDITPFPYVPGLLSFREVPVLIKALSCLKTPPDLLIVDGQGIAHPRRMGIAAHIGQLTDIPSIGVAKKKLCGNYDKEFLAYNGEAVLTYKKEKVGVVLQSKPRCNPLYISPGHRVSRETAARLVKDYLRGYRLPEPTRLADKLSKVM